MWREEGLGQLSGAEMEGSGADKTQGEKPAPDFAHWRRVLKQAVQDNDASRAIEALQYMIAVGRDTPSHWNRLISLLNQTGAESEATETLVRWRQLRPEQTVPQLTHAKRGLAGGTLAQLKALWPVYAADVAPELRVTACVNLLRREGADAIDEFLGAIDRATVPPLLARAARLEDGESFDIAGAESASPGELEIMTAIVARLARLGDARRALNGLRLLAAGMDERARVPGLNELLQTIAADGRPEAIAAMLPLARKNHHVLLREIFAAAIAEGRMALAAAALDRLHDMFRGNSSIFQLTLSIADAAEREAAFDRLLARQRHWAEADAAAAAVHGRNLMLCGRLTESRVALTSALLKWPGEARLHGELAETCFWLDDYESAETHARRALALGDDDSLGHCTLTQVAIARGDGGVALTHIEQARLAEAKMPPGLLFHALVCGERYQDAYQQYWSVNSGAYLTKVFPDNALRFERLADAILRNESLEGQTVVANIHGLGDEIRFSQISSWASQYCENATFTCDSRLLPLFRRSYPQLSFEGGKRGKNVAGLSKALSAHFDQHTAELARRSDHVTDIKSFLTFYRPDLVGFRPQRSYLSAEPSSQASWRSRLAASGEKQKVGLFWRSSIAGYHARHKRSELADWITLLKERPITIVPLQYGMNDSERRLLAENRELCWAPEFDMKDDIEQLAALMSVLDLVVALPGTTQHLAGALGVPTIMPAHPYDAAWRRNPKTLCDWWSPAVRIVTGQPSDGLKGSMAEAAHIVADWPLLTAEFGKSP